MERPRERRRSEQVIGFVWRLAAPLLWLVGWLAIGVNVGFYIPASGRSSGAVLSLLELLANSTLLLATLTLLGGAVGILLLANAVRSIVTSPPGFYNWFWLALVGIPLTAVIQVWLGTWSTWPATAVFLEVGVAVALILPGVVAWAVARRSAGQQ